MKGDGGDEGRWREMEGDEGRWREMKGDGGRWKEMKGDGKDERDRRDGDGGVRTVEDCDHVPDRRHRPPG